VDEKSSRDRSRPDWRYLVEAATIASPDKSKPGKSEMPELPHVRDFGQSVAHDRLHVFSQVSLFSSPWVSARVVSSILYSISRA